MQIRSFYLAKLVNAEGAHVASEEIWSDEGKSPMDPLEAARTAAMFFGADNHDPDDEGARILIYGPYVAAVPTGVYAAIPPEGMDEDYIVTLADPPENCAWPIAER